MQRGSAQLLLLLLVVLLFGVGVYFYKASKETPVVQNNTDKQSLKDKSFNNYANYSNKDLGFQLQYAKDLVVREDTEEEFNKRGNGDFRKNFNGYVGYEPAQVAGAVVVLGKDVQYGTNAFSVWVFNNDNNLAIQQWFDKYWYYPFVWGVFDYASKSHIALDTEATVSGQLAGSKVISYQPGSPKFVYVSKNNKMYLFRIIGGTGDKILSTFKFTN